MMATCARLAIFTAACAFAVAFPAEESSGEDQTPLKEMVSDPCANFACPLGQECLLLDLLALRGPNPVPAVPFCADVPTTEATTLAPDDPCEGFTCPPGQECHVIRPICRLCPPPPLALPSCRNRTSAITPETTEATAEETTEESC